MHGIPPPIVTSSLKLGDVPAQVFGANFVVNAFKTSLQ